MSETQEHLKLVERIVRYAQWRLRIHPAVAILSDLPTTPRLDKPPRISGFVPDVFATDVPTTFHLLGEAKTEGDVEQPHTVAQLTAFLAHLRIRGGILVVAVPWSVRPAAQRLLTMVAVATQAEGVDRVIIDDASPWH